MNSSQLQRHLSVVGGDRPTHDAGPLGPVCVFGPVAAMDEDGYSWPYTYAEKAMIEQQHLAEIEQRITEMGAGQGYNVAVAGETYCDDLRERVQRFEVLAAKDRYVAVPQAA
jgi:hypothetical protein